MFPIYANHDLAGFANITMTRSLLYHVYICEACFIMFIFAKPASSCLYLRSLLYHVYICEACFIMFIFKHESLLRMFIFDKEACFIKLYLRSLLRMFIFAKPALSCLYLRSRLYHVYICEACKYYHDYICLANIIMQVYKHENICEACKYKHDNSSLLYHVKFAGFCKYMIIFAKPALSCLYLRSLLYHVYICEACKY